MKAEKINIADNFWGMIKGLNADVRLELISRISNSLKTTKKTDELNSWHELFGAFESQLSAEEIIDDLRNSRHSNREIEAL